MSEQIFLISQDDIKIKKIIQEQSDQMLTMVDVINVYDNETKELNKKIKDLEKQNESTIKIFNNQILLFVALLIIALLMFYKMSHTSSNTVVV